MTINISTNVSSTADKKMKVSSTPYGYDIAKGNMSGHEQFFKTGFNGSVDNVEVDLWSVTSAYVFTSVGIPMQVVSASTNDTSPSGAGVHKVRIWYLNTAFDEKVETVSLNGTTEVKTSANDIYRVNAFRALEAGSGGKAAGNISLTDVSGIIYYSQIATGQTRARSSIYTVPAGKTLYITELTYSVGHASGNRYARFTLRATYDEVVGAISSLFYPYHEIGLQDGAIDINLNTPLRFPAGTDVKVSVISDSGTANAICTAAFRGWLE
jgi:hypothetical protein